MRDFFTGKLAPPPWAPIIPKESQPIQPITEEAFRLREIILADRRGF